MSDLGLYLIRTELSTSGVISCPIRLDIPLVLCDMDCSLVEMKVAEGSLVREHNGNVHISTLSAPPTEPLALPEELLQTTESGP